jgi:hypothetical protein
MSTTLATPENLTMNLYIPITYIHNPPPPVNPRGFGVGFHSGNRVSYDRLMRLLHPPCVHDWGSLRQIIEWQPTEMYPCIWNPYPHDRMRTAYKPDFARVKTTGRYWFIGNEPLAADTRTPYWSPEQLAEQCNTFFGETGCEYIICGEVPDDAGFAYTRRAAELCQPSGFHFHIYRLYASDFVKDLEACMRFAGNRPIFITETNARGGDLDSQKRLMDTILDCLQRWPQVHAVFWFASYWQDTHNVEVLLTDGGPTCQLNDTGRYYTTLR